MGRQADIRRLRRLLARVKSDVGEEAAVARKLADELLEKLDLREEDILPPELIGIFVHHLGQGRPADVLAGAVAASRGCTALPRKMGSEIRGPQHAAENAVEVLQALLRSATSARPPNLATQFGRPGAAAWLGVLWAGFIDTTLNYLNPPASVWDKPSGDGGSGDVVQTAQNEAPTEAPASAFGTNEDVERIGKLFDELALNPFVTQDMIQLIYRDGYEAGVARSAETMRPYRKPYRTPDPPEPASIPAGIRGLLAAP